MGRHVLVWIVLILLNVLGVPALFSQSELMGRVYAELTLIQRALGQETAVKVSQQATKAYTEIFIETGIVRATNRAMVSEEEKHGSESMLGQGGRNLSNKTNEYLTAFSALCYAALIRVLIVAYWIPYVLPFLGAALVDALVTRKVRMATFGRASPIVFVWSAHMLIGMLFIPLIGLVAPIALSPLAFPFWLMATCVPLYCMVTSTQRI